MTLRLSPGDDPQNIVEDRYNAFHDGFVQEVRLRSRDVFTVEGDEPWDIGHRTTGRFDAVLTFAHYNFPPGELQSHERIVEVAFRDVRGFFLDLREWKAHDWPIQNVEIAASRRPGLQDATAEACFELTITWSRLEAGAWTTRRVTLFTFSEARFDER